MAARSKARKRAVDVLYEADVRGGDRLSAARASGIADGDPPVPEHTVRLVEGVAEHAARIDELIDTHASNWSIDRLPDVDRAILRMAAFELLWADDVPDAVVIDEAVELAKALSTDDSPAYVNGVLGAILAAEVPTAEAAETVVSDRVRGPGRVAARCPAWLSDGRGRLVARCRRRRLVAVSAGGAAALPVRVELVVLVVAGAHVDDRAPCRGRARPTR